MKFIVTNLRFVIAVCVFLALPLVALAQVPIPNTPAGKVLQAFFEAFNSADQAKLATYVKEYDPTVTADQLLAFSGQTGGFTLLSIKSSATDKIIFLVKGRSDNIEAFGNLQLATTAPPQVKMLSIRAIPPGATMDDITLTSALRQQAIQAVSVRLTDYYIYPDVAKQMIQAVQEHQKRGDYDAITDGNEFANALTHDLRAVSYDKHLFVGYNPFTTEKHPGAEGPHPPSAAERERFRAMLEHDNCFFSRVEVLPRNIGYLKFGAFADPDFCGPTVAAAMEFLAHTDVLIFDMRDNHGGDPSMVQLVVSYLFSEPTHINDMIDRHDNTTRQYWTLPSVPGPRFTGKPVFVLTSSQTFSGAEEFTYDLQTQKRATIVGEITGGGAHPVHGMSAGDHFVIGVPRGRPVNPITKKDWEGTGVLPDVKVPANDALTTAQKLAGEKLLSK